MTIPVSVLTTLATLGLTADQASAVATMLREVEDATQIEGSRATDGAKEKARARSKRWRERNVTQRHATSRDVEERDAPPPSLDKKAPHTPKELIPSAPASSAREGFADFWAAYPNKVGKADAQRAFSKALQRVDLNTMMAGLGRYAAKSDDRPWCNPATWLNQDRWADEPATQLPRAGPQPRENGVVSLIDHMLSQMEQSHVGPTIDSEPNPPPARQFSGARW